MELEVLKKKLSTFKTARGQVRNVNDELLIEVLSAWEEWTGPTKAFSSAIGVSGKGISSMIGKAKRLKREGFAVDGFKEIKVAAEPAVSSDSCTSPITMKWGKGRVIRFSQVEQLVAFLNIMESKQAS